MDFSLSIQRALRAPTPAAANYFRAAFNPSYSKVRYTWSRMEKIRKLLMNGEAFNTNTICEAFGFARKTLHRDIEHLRKLGMAISYDPVKNTFRLGNGKGAK